MKLATKIIGIFLLGSSTVATAALPPFYQSQREIKRLIESDELANLFQSGRAIESVARVTDEFDRTYYVVNSRDCEAKIEIIYSQPTRGMIGPANFEFVFPAQLTCD